MTPPDYEKLAREFLQLWQKQLTSVVSDKQFIHAMLEMMQSIQKGTYAKQGKNAHSNPSTASDDALRLDELTFRLAMCEKRLAALESGRKASRAAKKPAKRSPKSRK